MRVYKLELEFQAVVNSLTLVLGTGQENSGPLNEQQVLLITKHLSSPHKSQGARAHVCNPSAPKANFRSLQARWLCMLHSKQPQRDPDLKQGGRQGLTQEAVFLPPQRAWQECTSTHTHKHMQTHTSYMQK